MRAADEGFMRRCLHLARQGIGSVSPNPMVGSVIVYEGRIIAEGYHQRYGEAHAEVNAIAAVQDEALLSRSTLYVNLEPCSHWGKTPPCADLIVEKGIPRVVIGCRDPHLRVAGRGIEKLRSAGVDVLEGVLEQEAKRLNEAFIKSHTDALPFVTLKLAQTLDGRIATSEGLSKWITGEDSRKAVHRMRSEHDAVLTGMATASLDRASLTVRHCAGRNPTRVVLATSADVDLSLPVFDGEAPTLLFLPSGCVDGDVADRFSRSGIELACVDRGQTGLELLQVMRELHRRRMLSVLVEGGSRLASSLVRQRLVDRLAMFVAPRIFGGDGMPSFAPLGVQTPDDAIQLEFEAFSRCGADYLVEAKMV